MTPLQDVLPAGAVAKPIGVIQGVGWEFAGLEVAQYTESRWLEFEGESWEVTDWPDWILTKFLTEWAGSRYLCDVEAAYDEGYAHGWQEAKDESV